MAELRIDLGTFDASHQIPTHKGKCKNLHGHTYHVFAEIAGTIKEDPEKGDFGMVVDFGVLKDVYKARIHGQVDHSLILGTRPLPWLSAFVSLAEAHYASLVTDDPDTHAAATAMCEELIGRVVHLPIPVTTAEHMAQWIADELVEGIMEAGGGDFLLTKVEVWETPTACGLWVYSMNEDTQPIIGMKDTLHFNVDMGAIEQQLSEYPAGAPDYNDA